MTLYHVKIARTPEEHYQGLSDVLRLPAYCGMLFVFDPMTADAFCNRRTYVPLDLLFLGNDGEIQEMGSLASCLEQSSAQVTPKYAYRAALEVPRGTAARHGLRIGDRLGLWLTAPSDHGMWAQVLRRSPVSSRSLRAPVLPGT